jgi:hypothetical protein
MEQSQLLLRLQKITGDLRPGAESSATDLDDLRHNFAQALLNHGALTVAGNGLLSSPAQVAMDPQRAAEEIVRLRLQPPVAQVQPLIFRRETPFRNGLLGTSVADWGVGLSPSKSFGPFLTEQGLPVWFDFFFPTRLVQVTFVGSSDPILAIPVWGALSGHSSFKIESGSVWLASGLIAQDPALKGYFSGLKVRGGRLDLSQNTVINNGQIQIVPGTTAKLNLDLDQNKDVSPSGDAGFDAADVVISLPQKFVINFNAASSTLQAGDASCKVFGCATELRSTGKPATWLAPFGQILIPYAVKTDSASGDVFTVRSSRSKNFTLAREAKLDNGSGWLVPAARIDPQNFGQASGTGAIAIALSKGIEGRWTGLRGGQTRFEHPAIIVEPNMVSLVDFFAANVYGRQKWTLWQNPKSSHHSEVVLSFGKAFSFLFVSNSAGAEVVTYFCNHKDSLDRPVDGNGRPFKIESAGALASLVQIGPDRFATLFDADLLLDGSNGALLFERSSIVLRNAFFSVSHPYSLLLFGTLLDSADGDVIFKSGVLTLTYAIFSYIPTLPDPYVSNYQGSPARSQALTASFHSALAGFVQWPNSAPGQPADDPDPAQVYFRFISANRSLLAPAANYRAAGTLLATDIAGLRLAQDPAVRDFRTGLGTLNQDLVGDSAVISLPIAASAEVWNPLKSELSSSLNSTVTLRGRIENAVATGEINSVLDEMEKNPLLAHIPDKRALVNSVLTASVAQPAMLENNQQQLASFLKQPDVSFRDFFMLLDVSSNADQMGVSLGNAIRVEQDREGETKLQTTIADISVTTSAAASSPLQIQKMDVVAPANYVRAMTLPQISWEPFFNIPLAIEGKTPPDQVTVTPGLMLFDDDGPPTWIASCSPLPVPIAPLPVTGHLVKEFRNERQPRRLRTYFGLPFGMVAQTDFQPKPPSEPGPASDVSIHKPHFDQVRGGLQIKARSLTPAVPLPGFARQQDNLKWFLGGAKISGTTLGSIVRTFFEDEFDQPNGHVPLERIEFCGYGASIFSNWHNDKPTVADVSQVKFEVLLGRTAHEVVQVRSILYPFGVHVVRTVTLMRSPSGYVFRSDSGWKAESDGFFDFRYDIRMPDATDRTMPNPYVFHSGTVKGVSRVREIKDFFDAGVYTSSFQAAECGLDPADLNLLFKVAPTDFLPVKLEPVVFDADVHLDNVVSGGASQPGGDSVVQSRKMLGYVQLEPAHVLIPPRIFADLLTSQNGSLGGPVDCVIDINRSQQRMRLSRVDVSPALDASGNHLFVTAERGSLVLPKDGSWSVVQQHTDTGDVDPLDPGRSVPLIQANGDTALRIANPADVVQPSSKRNYGVLQSTGTQKLLFTSPTFLPGTPKLTSADTFFADAYKLLNGKGPFPNVANALALPSAQRQLDILGEGLLKFKNATLRLPDLLPATYNFPFIDVKDVVKIYAEYSTEPGGKGTVDLGIDSAAAPGDRWKAALSNIRVVVDLGPFARLMWVDGNFDASSGVDPKYNKPNLQFGRTLDKVKDILQVLARLSGDDFDNGMSVGMSNSPDDWEYKFNCSQEIPVIKFPSPDELVLDPNPPLKLEAGLRVGFYFNEVISVPTDLKQLVPACGAYVDFYGRIEVVCLSLAIASVYGVGQVSLGIVGDTKAGKLLKMRFGFGAEVVVGLPVVLNVSVLYVVGIQLDLGDTGVTMGASLMFRGSAEICGGLVSIGIQIEAAGSVKRDGSSTNCIAQVTFAIDVTVAWVIDIDESYQWQETRQIA